MVALPPHTQFAVTALLIDLDIVEAAIGTFEETMATLYSETEEIKLLPTIPRIGAILAEVIASEIGAISRSATPARLASDASTTPSVHASSGKYRHVRAPADTNHYLKWAYAETPDTIIRVRRRLRYRHVADLDDQI